MEAPQSPTNLRLTAEDTVSLLESWLTAHKFKPSEGLKALFEEIALIGVQYSSSRHEISSRFLFFAAAQATLSERYDHEERQALLRLQSFAQGSPSYVTQKEAYFRRDRGMLGVEKPKLTPNIERLLISAITHARRRRGPKSVMTVADLLRDFPPEGSMAQMLVANLGGSPGSWQFLEDSEGDAEAAPSPAETIDLGSEGTDFRSGAPAILSDSGAMDAAGLTARTDQRAKAKTSVTSRKAHPKVNERIFTHSDEPAINDYLGRKPFAEVLAGRIREVREAGGKENPAAFVVHVHGPWGSGKSTVLNFLEQTLARDTNPKGTNSKTARAWLVVRFDAWRNQRLQPPWWSLITTIYAAARRSLNWRDALRLRIRWLIWRIRADYVPLIAVMACATALLLLVLWVGAPGGTTPPRSGNEELFANWLDKLLKLIAGAITIIGAIVLWSRSLAMGSQRAAQAYADLKADPYGPIANLFKNLIDAIDPPLVVFVDDLDRCESKYVVDLLEGIQTLMRAAPVTYVVAGDRKWICSSFEQRYGAFTPPIGEPGRPLGYLFLDKIFQISAAIPQAGAEAQRAYWKGLLNPNAPVAEGQREKLLEAEIKAEADAARWTQQEDLQNLVSTAEKLGDPETIQATRAAAAKRIASQPVLAETENRLERYYRLLEHNPRAMKRLVNAYGMHQAALFLAGRSCSADALARWTILELRWPLLADFLANRPACVTLLYEPLAKDALRQVPAPLRDLFGDESVTAVIGAKNSRSRLSPIAIRSILGDSQGER